MHKVLKTFLLFLIISGITLTAKEEIQYADKPYDLRLTYGVFGNFGLNLHSADFQKIPGTFSCCPGYETGTGFGFSGGILVNFPIGEKMEISVRALYTNLSGIPTTIEETTVADANGNGVSGEFEHTVDANLSSVGLAPLFSYRITEPMALSIGFRAGYLLSADYAQKEEIISPSNGTFLGSSRTRNEFSGDIPDAAALEMAMLAGVSYDLPLNQESTLFLSPEIFYSLGFTSMAADLSWNVSSLSGGIALKYAPREIIPPAPPPPPPPPPPIPPPPPPPEAPVLDASIIAVSVDEEGKESDVTRIRVEEFLSRRVNPLLNYIFFDEGKAEIPERYVRLTEDEKPKFSDRFLYDLKTMEVYHTILNIIGQRMMKFPIANLTLTGCNSDEGVEANNTELSKQRAENVKNFIVSEWGIDPARIKTEARNLPSLPSNPKEPLGIVENRRVEIESNSEQIFKELTVRDTIRITNPPLIRFKPQVMAEIGINSWKITTWQESVGELKTFEGTGVLPGHLEWDLVKDDKTVPTFDEDFLYKLEVVDNDNKKWESPVQRLKVEPYTIQNKYLAMMDGKIVNDKEYDEFSLISFGFNKATLNKEHLKLIEMAKQRTGENSKVRIFGHSDIIGDEELNKELSQKRANSVARGMGVDLNNAIGLGEAEPLYTNESPEGRFYNRSVLIQVETTFEFEE